MKALILSGLAACMLTSAAVAQDQDQTAEEQPIASAPAEAAPDAARAPQDEVVEAQEAPAAEAPEAAYLSSEEAQAKYAKHPAHVHWHHDGITGVYDQAQLQRGLQVYKQVCAACHGLTLVAFRDLEALGYSSEQVKAFAAEYTVQDGPNDDGDMFDRPGKPSDYFPSPFANERQAQAINNGVAPPDLSVIVKAREGGADYVHALLTGFEDAPADVLVTGAQNYNPYFPAMVMVMPPPLFEGAVEYADGTPATVHQMAEDVTAFLTWAADPKLVDRKEMGVMVLLFLAFFTVITYVSYRRTWADVKK